MSKIEKDEGLFDGYRTQEQRDLAMLNAALNKDPSFYRGGKMTEDEKEEYNRMVEWVKTLPEGATIDVGYNMD